MLGEGALLAAIGVLIGIPGIYAASRLIRGVLVGISPTDPLTLATVGGTLAAVALLASLIPAYRASRIDPLDALRAD